MTRRYYILAQQQAVRAPNQLAWARWFRMTDVRERVVQNDQLGEVYISTSFLGAEDQLFQTAVFGGALDGRTVYYHTYEEAQAGHTTIVDQVRRA